MNNNTVIYFTRHAESIANRNGQYPNPNLKPHAFTDAPLSGHGYAQVIENRYKKLEHLGVADYIFCSPMKRAMQTCLLTYNNINVDANIYLTSLLIEFDKYPDCEGRPVTQIITDPELMTYNNSNKINLDYFWTDNPHQITGEWYEPGFRYNLHHRIALFFNIFKDDKFTNKVVHVYSHAGFIGNIPEFNRSIANYNTVKVTINRDNWTWKCELV